MVSACSRTRVLQLLHNISLGSCKCPAHAGGATRVLQHNESVSHRKTDYAFEMACSNIRYGIGVTREVGQDVKNFGAKKVCVMTDGNLVNLPPVKAVLDSLHRNGVEYQLYDKVRVEPTDESFLNASEFCRAGNFDLYIAVGGGSVMDTCKAGNLLASDREAELFDYVNAPIGKGLPIKVTCAPLIAVPTTTGTGSETTGTAIFDYTAMKAKTGISSRALRPTLGIVDPLHALTQPERVVAFSGFDVFCHALESYTCLPYTERKPCPTDPILRPAYQGSNPISDVWSRHALRICKDYFQRAVFDEEDLEARSQMHLASAAAGIGFGNAGVHLCHGLSYPISGNVKTFVSPGYSPKNPLVPHGLSVVLTAPAVFNYTSPSSPERHLDAAELLGADVSKAKKEDAGKILSDVVRKYMDKMKISDGLKSIGYTAKDIPDLVEGALPQERILKLSPRERSREDLSKILEDSLTVY